MALGSGRTFTSGDVANVGWAGEFGSIRLAPILRIVVTFDRTIGEKKYRNESHSWLFLVVVGYGRRGI
jgi:hypothetical protein